MAGHCFISYSHADGLKFVEKLILELEGGYPSIPVWFEKRDMHVDKDDWDDQLAKAIQQCKCLIYVMSQDSTAGHSNCKDEWTWALKYKKPVICLWIDGKAEEQFRLNSRQKIDFTADFVAGLGKLRKAIAHLDSPEGQLEELNHRLADANRDLRRASDADKLRIQADIDDLKKQIEVQQNIVNNPKKAEEQTQKNIEAGLERERKPQLPLAAIQSSKFINPPPGIAPNYFQDRTVETKQVFDFLKDDAQRLMTIVGRGGVGKTAMICRLLKYLENGAVPEDVKKAFPETQPIKVDGIIYLSESGSHRVNFANIFYDLCKLPPKDTADALDAVYKNPQGSTASKMHQLLEKFTDGRVVLLLDNFEPVVDTETFEIKDAELNEALTAFLNGTHTSVNIVITTRIAPKKLNLLQRGRQRSLDLDDGLDTPYAENILREMDSDGRLGLKSAGAEALNRARIKTRGFPRALEALFAILASDRYTTLEELLAMPLPENVVEALVGEAFNRLDTNAQKVMQALAVYNRPVTPAAVDFLLAPHIPAMDSAPILQRLANMHFARKESGRFYLHPVDKDFALGLLPEGNPDDKVRSGSGIELMRYFGEKIQSKYPDLVGNFEELKSQKVQDAFREITKTENPELIRDLFAGYHNLNQDLVQKIQDPNNFGDEDFLRELDQSLQIPQVWTRYALTFRAADYFAQARKPRAEWKKLEDLSAQLAEFGLRCAIGDYDVAAELFINLEDEYLFLWGHYHLIIEMHEKLQGKIQDRSIAMVSLDSIGKAYDSIGETKRGIVFQEKGLQIARELSDLSAEAMFLENLGNYYSALSDVRKSIEHYERALSIARETRNRESESFDFSKLGSAYIYLGDVRKAIEYYEQALGIDREIGDCEGEGSDLSSLGSAYIHLGDARKAIEYYEQALGIDREIGNRKGEGSRLNNLGRAYIDLGDARKAIEYYEQALGIDREIGNRKGEGSDLSSLGGAYIALGDARKAIEYYEQALGIDCEIGDRKGEGSDLSSLGNAYIILGDVRKAIEFYEQALIIARKIGNRMNEGGNLGSLGDAYDILGDTRKAVEYYEQALSIDREIGDKQSEGVDLGSLGNVYAVLGDVRKAIEYYEHALSIEREIGNRGGEETILVNLAEALSMDGQFSHASNIAKQSLFIAIEMEIPPTYEYEIVSKVCLFNGQIEDALINIIEAQRFYKPNNYYNNISTLHGIIALRQGDEVTARGAFVRAIGQADEILSKTAEYYSALDAKGLALCGLAIADDGRQTMNDGKQTVDDGRQTIVNGPSSMVYRQQAIEVFQKARQIAPHAGVVKSVLRLFDELVKCDKDGILKDVREVIEVKPLE